MLKGEKDYYPQRLGKAVYRDPSRFCLYVVAVRYTIVSSPYYTAGVSSFPGPVVGGCNPRPGRSIVLSAPSGLPPSLRDYRALIEPTAYAAGAL